MTRWGYSAVTPETFQRYTDLKLKGAWVSGEEKIGEALSKVKQLGRTSVAREIDIEAHTSAGPPRVPVCADQILSHPI